MAAFHLQRRDVPDLFIRRLSERSAVGCSGFPLGPVGPTQNQSQMVQLLRGNVAFAVAFTDALQAAALPASGAASPPTGPGRFLL